MNFTENIEENIRVTRRSLSRYS